MSIIRKLLLSRPCFPYEFVTNFSKLECRTLPHIDHLYSEFKRYDVSDGEQTPDQTVWSTLGFQDLKDYMVAYLLVDVGLLADILEN